MKQSITLTNRLGVKFCYLKSSVSTVGSGSYLTRVLDARKETGADVFVFIIPNSSQAGKILGRINRGTVDLKAAVKPLILPFKIIVRIGQVSPHVLQKEQFDLCDWESVKY